MVALATLNNRAAISYNTKMKDWECFGEPTEAAIKVFAEKLNKINSAAYDMKASPKKSEDDLRKSVQEIAVLDFSSERKTMSTVVKGYQGA
jgi:magnesium-transporting ATPase (P-type)